MTYARMIDSEPSIALADAKQVEMVRPADWVAIVERARQQRAAFIGTSLSRMLARLFRTQPALRQTVKSVPAC
jgi:hypothetical protein